MARKSLDESLSANIIKKRLQKPNGKLTFHIEDRKKNNHFLESTIRLNKLETIGGEYNGEDYINDEEK